MVLYGNKLIKKIKKHGYSILDLLNLPKSLAYPIAVFDTEVDGSRIALAEIKDHKGNNFVVSVRLWEWDTGRGECDHVSVR